jgi:sodium-coupled neutral amino acid transporter 11
MPVQTIELPNSYSYVRSPSPKGTHEDSAASRSSSFSNSQSAIAANLDADNTTSPTSTAKLSSPKQLSGVFGASSNLVNSIVGAGIIGIPYALRESGLIAGLLLLVLVSYLTDKSLRVIVGLASFHPKLRNKDVRTFEDLASFPFGSAGRNFILLNMFIM